MEEQPPPSTESSPTPEAITQPAAQPAEPAQPVVEQAVAPAVQNVSATPTTPASSPVEGAPTSQTTSSAATAVTPPIGVGAAGTNIGLPGNGAVGVNGPFPEELRGWNWGAFLLTWIWGVAHSTWISLLVLLSFIPLVGWVISLGTAIMLGMRGNELAWHNRRFTSVEQFKQVQKAWTRVGIGLALVGAVFFILAVILVMSQGGVENLESLNQS